MDDYIKRKLAYDALCKICDGRDVCEHTGQEGCHKVFSQIPAADVVEVVRCKDCKHCHLMFNKSLICWNCNSSVKFPISADDFCCHGERRGKTDDAE